jgi:hypothetical protein
MQKLGRSEEHLGHSQHDNRPSYNLFPRNIPAKMRHDKVGGEIRDHLAQKDQANLILIQFKNILECLCHKGGVKGIAKHAAANRTIEHQIFNG